MNIPQIGEVDREALGDLSVDLQKEIDNQITTTVLPWPNVNCGIGGGYRPGSVTVIAGTEGSGKTFFVLWQMLSMTEQHKTWLYMPLEGSSKDYLRRIVAMRTNRWDALSLDSKHSTITADALNREKNFYTSIQGHICKNPRAAIEYQIGDEVKKYAPDLPYKKMLEEFIEPNMKYSDIIIVDPITMMDYDKSHNPEETWRIKEYEGQQKFINQLVSLVNGSNCHVILVMHMTKDGKYVQGSSSFTRFVHNVLLFQRHEKTSSRIIGRPRWSGDNETREIEHEKTLTIMKTRNGKGAGWKIAYDFDFDSPTLCEYGVIVPEIK